MLDAGVDLRDVQIAARHANPHHHVVGQGPPEPGPSPQLHPGRLHGLRHLTRTMPPAAHAARGTRQCR
jgi:hypothetical protein